MLLGLFPKVVYIQAFTASQIHIYTRQNPKNDAVTTFI